MSFNKQDIIKYRFERAEETILEAQLLAKNSHWNSVANRLYYACFYAVIGLLLSHSLLTKSHNGVKSLLNKEFVKTGLLDKKWALIYSELFNKRQESDYKDIKRFTAEEIEPLIAKAEEFIKVIKSLKHNNN